MHGQSFNGFQRAIRGLLQRAKKKERKRHFFLWMLDGFQEPPDYSPKKGSKKEPHKGGLPLLFIPFSFFLKTYIRNGKGGLKDKM